MFESRKSFEQQLDEIRAGILGLAATVIESIPRVTEALLSGDLRVADEIIAADPELNQRAHELEERCYQTLALQQPMAGHMRTIVTSVRMVAEIERSGDLLVNICKAIRRLYGVPLDPRLRGLITDMGEQAHQLFRFALDAYADRDAPLAGALDDIDDTLDRTHADYIQSIFLCHHDGQLPLQVAVQLALIGRFYERIGDHAVNIGERVRYMVTGWLPMHEEVGDRTLAEPGEGGVAT